LFFLSCKSTLDVFVTSGFIKLAQVARQRNGSRSDLTSAAINEQFDTGDETGVIRSKKQRYPSHFLIRVEFVYEYKTSQECRFQRADGAAAGTALDFAADPSGDSSGAMRWIGLQELTDRLQPRDGGRTYGARYYFSKRPSPLLLRAPTRARARRAGLDCDAPPALPWQSAEETSSRPAHWENWPWQKGAPQRREVVIVIKPASLILGRFS